MSVKIHFLNVGAGDCTIIHFPARTRGDKSLNERIMMVDINHNPTDRNYQNVINYYKENFRDDNGSIKPIFRFICTHPHQDHICGLDTLKNDPDITIANFWDLAHDFEPENFDYYPTHEADWKAYKNLTGEKSTATVIRTSREDEPGKYWNNEEDRISILSPCKELRRYAHYKEDGTKREKTKIEIDEMSYALVIQINSRKILLGGEGRTTPFWENIYTNCKDLIKNCSIIKASHHGQEAGFHEEAVKLINPEYIVFSNSEKEDEDYGAEGLYKKAVPKATILKTCEPGNIVFEVPFDKSEEIVFKQVIHGQ